MKMSLYSSNSAANWPLSECDVRMESLHERSQVWRPPYHNSLSASVSASSLSAALVLHSLLQLLPAAHSPPINNSWHRRVRWYPHSVSSYISVNGSPPLRLRCHHQQAGQKSLSISWVAPLDSSSRTTCTSLQNVLISSTYPAISFFQLWILRQVD